MYYKIAEWIVEYSPRYEKLRKKMVPYELELNEKREDFVPDISLKYNEAYQKLQKPMFIQQILWQYYQQNSMLQKK